MVRQHNFLIWNANKVKCVIETFEYLLQYVAQMEIFLDTNFKIISNNCRLPLGDTLIDPISEVLVNFFEEKDGHFGDFSADYVLQFSMFPMCAERRCVVTIERPFEK